MKVKQKSRLYQNKLFLIIWMLNIIGSFVIIFLLKKSEDSLISLIPIIIASNLISIIPVAIYTKFIFWLFIKNHTVWGLIIYIGLTLFIGLINLASNFNSETKCKKIESELMQLNEQASSNIFNSELELQYQDKYLEYLTEC